MAEQKAKKKAGSRPADKKAGNKPVARKAGTRPAAKKKSREPEPTPVVGGRFLLAVLIVFVMVVVPMSKLGDFFQKPGPGKTNTANWRKGNTTEVRITLVTSDYNNLSCASEKSLDGAHCAYKSESEGWPRAAGEPLDDNKKNIIQPYRTWPDNQLILVAGLWATPHVAMRLHDEPPAGVPAKKLARFVATCKVRFLGQLDGAKLHWNAGGKWMNQPRAMVARALSCKIGEEK